MTESIRQFQLLVEGIREYALVMLGAEGEVRLWNPGAERLYGYAAEEVLGADFSILCAPPDVVVGKPKAELRASRAYGRFEDEGWRARKGGATFWANVVITPLASSSSEPAGFAMVTCDLTERRKLEEDFALANERLRALASHVNSASEQEKGRLAREIHDVLGQQLTGLKLDAAWITRRLTRSEARDELAPVLQRLREMSGQIDGCVDSVRRIATGLRPGVLDDLGLTAAIDWQAREFESRSGIATHVALPELDISVDRERATAAFRIFQELLTNVARHAQARAVDVALALDSAYLTLQVRDDGRGITELETNSPQSLGILGMRERLAPFGGTLEVQGGVRRGTHIMVRIPVLHD